MTGSSESTRPCSRRRAAAAIRSGRQARQRRNKRPLYYRGLSRYSRYVDFGVALHLLPGSRAHRRQDLFALSELDVKRNGFFVEFGATDGVYLSNTCLLEKEFGWTGILAEPARCWSTALAQNRLARIDLDCVWKRTGDVLVFNEAADGSLSTLDGFSGGDKHHRRRRHGTKYEVKTVSLMDLLARHGAPAEIDYLSVDTEGSEFDILEHFDFDRYKIRIITCEHNFTPNRERVFRLLASKGYRRKFENLSKADDGYVPDAG